MLPKKIIVHDKHATRNIFGLCVFFLSNRKIDKANWALNSTQKWTTNIGKKIRPTNSLDKHCILKMVLKANVMASNVRIYGLVFSLMNKFACGERDRGSKWLNKHKWKLRLFPDKKYKQIHCKLEQSEEVFFFCYFGLNNYWYILAVFSHEMRCRKLIVIINELFFVLCVVGWIGQNFFF